MTAGSVRAEGGVAAGKERDLRLDFFRGLAMFIILLAHTYNTTWTLWIPARFGFSDATEIFVFCSGFASALAFGAVFVKRGWAMGAARVAYRVWQVYWAHLMVIFACAVLMVGLDATGLGHADELYREWWPVAGIFTDPAVAVPGFFTLTNVPGLFDILPMYLVILALVPLAMAAHRFGGLPGFLGLVAAFWLATQFAFWAYMTDPAETHALGAWAAEIGAAFSFLILPSNPWGEGTWFFNPFGWQLVFFTGFAYGMRWLPAPKVTPARLRAVGAFLLLTVPFAWFRIYNGDYLPSAWTVSAHIREARDWIDPLIGKTGLGALRYLHFLGVAYLAWAAVGPGGVRLREGGRAIGGLRSRGAVVALAALALFTAPYAYVDTIRALSPALDAWLVRAYASIGALPDEWRIGALQLLHLAALLPLVWTAIGAAGRAWVARDGVLLVVPVIRKVGTQSLAVFLTSLVVARFNSWWLDVIGRDVWTQLLVNGTGFAAIVATAYAIGWFKRQPWREPAKPRPAENAPAAVAPAPAPRYLGAS